MNAAQAEALILENRRVTIRDLFVSLEVYTTLSMKNRGAVEVMDAGRKSTKTKVSSKLFQILNSLKKEASSWNSL